MPKRREINADPGGSGLRSAATAVGDSVRAIGFALEERLLWRGVDLARKLAEAARWPFERLAWLLEQRLIWPLQERAAGRGPSGNHVGAGALAAIAVGITTLGVIAMVGGNDGSGQQVTRVANVAEVSPPADEKPSGPVLRGAPPSFDVEGGVGVASSTSDGLGAVAVGADADAVASTGSTAATTSSQKPVPAGPAAMKVARRFADAFLFYEIGSREARAHSVFAETAAPQLERALIERPPRQPASIEVPQARLLNLVPGPRHGNAYTVSASLLRVGTTSELRLEMRKVNGNWVVTDVRG